MGCDVIQWAIQVIAMEGGENLAAMSADAINAFNEQHREAMRAALLANPALHNNECIWPARLV